MGRSGLRLARRSAAVLPLGAIAAVGSRDLLILAASAAVLVLVIVAVVVIPAVWSKKKQRRDSALAVLDRIFGRGS
jgi:hypothetical protein